MLHFDLPTTHQLAAIELAIVTAFLSRTSPLKGLSRWQAALILINEHDLFAARYMARDVWTTVRRMIMSEPRNRAVQVRRFGGPDELEVVEAPLSNAGRGEVRVRVVASGLEYTDVLIRRHLYPQTVARRPPFVLGYDVVGEIDQLGDSVGGFQVGDRVADMTVLGSNCAYRTLRASDLTRVPRGVDAAEAAALILSWTTAYQLLHRAARVQQGQRVLVHGAAGAVGQALIVLYGRP
jgi:D-arabinose 1-dehydrogenase-like Zn-dependent alcohol dehydrogenase